MGRRKGYEDIDLGDAFMRLCIGQTKQRVSEKQGFVRQSVNRKINNLGKELTPVQIQKLILKEIKSVDVENFII